MESGTIQAQASVIREFISHPGMKLLVEAVQGKMKSAEHSWLNAKTADEAEQVRQAARSYGILMGTLNQFLLRAKADEVKPKE